MAGQHRTKMKWLNRVLTISSGPMNDENVGETTGATTAVSNYGVTRCRATANATVKFDPPALGSKKTLIVADTTFAITLNSAAATINNSTDSKITVTPTTKTKALGFGFDFHGASTSMWYMKTSLTDINSTQATVTMTSS